ncbi:hypothetical protein Pan216_13050 [Planctomycetes bacterium Pan216]|uniref:Uncharacterized protein n=1 Tax=Kolteria novifilia TaxID=2527975 RepID=A0A518B0I2_9BACT|nr:hypothetical protein Pan216_13050 [Planctomycetes bacterium Pan216]
MEWERLKNNYTVATVNAGEPIEDAMVELCTHILEVIIPENRNVSWDYLRVELWPDSGRIIVFPSSLSNPNRIEDSGCQIVFDNLLEEYDRLAESGLDDDVFDAKILELEQRWVNILSKIVTKLGLAKYRIQFWDPDDQLLELQNEVD